MRMTDNRLLSINGGWGIPYIRYRPSGGDNGFVRQSPQVRPSVHLIPKYLGEDAWQVSLVTELVDFLNYPRIDKIYLDYETRLRLGDTLVCKRLVPKEVSDDRSIRTEVAGPAETLIFLTLVE